MKCEIRRATAADAHEAAAAFSASFLSMTFVPKMHSDAEDLAFIRQLISHKECWIAEFEGRVIGIACYNAGWLEQLYVAPPYHNRGAGTLLLHRVMHAHPEGFQFWTFQANAGARRFYERNGCVAVEFTDGSGTEEKTADVRYEWRP